MGGRVGGSMSARRGRGERETDYLTLMWVSLMISVKFLPSTYAPPSRISLVSLSNKRLSSPAKPTPS